MNQDTWPSRVSAVLFFPDSVYLTQKWWHRLAIVVLCVWLLFAGAAAVHNLWDIYEGFEYARMYGHEEGFYFSPWERARENTVFCALWLLSVFAVAAVYRVILFICLGGAWKGDPAR